MSTNPFRRSSLKDPGGNLNRTISDHTGRTASPLSVDTRVSNPSQKHVNFASPPAVPISPASFPPSPESSRYSPGVDASRLVLPAPTDYSEALQNDPFEEDFFNDDEDGPIEQAIQNAKTNTAQTTIPIASPSHSKDDAVRNTLSRFSAAPKRTSTRHVPDTKQETGRPQKPLMDVDAFKRLLLTGESGTSTPKGGIPQSAQSANAPAISDSSSIADTASISQTSIFETTTSAAVEESPRSSYELDTTEADIQRRKMATPTAQEPRRKPPPPKTRHGKSLNSATPVASVANDTSSNPLITGQLEDHTYSEQRSSENLTEINKSYTTGQGLIEATDQESSRKRPPTPPLSRRHSHHRVPQPTPSRSSSLHQSPTESFKNVSDQSNTLSIPKKPPPPPLRRHISNERRTESYLPLTSEGQRKSDSIASNLPSQENVAVRAPDQYPLSKVQTPTGPPPRLPPPRRNRGSSRSSVDGQRPSPFVLGGTSFASNQNNNPSPHPEGRSASGGPLTVDILADLAALQKEVDEARSRGVRE